MDVFLVLQILFDAVLLFGVLFLFHFSVNQQQKKKEEIDIVKTIQVQETKESLEKLLFTMRQLGKDVSDDIQAKINESEEKAGVLQESLKVVEERLNATLDFSGSVNADRGRLKNQVRSAKKMPNKKERLPSDEKGADKVVSRSEKKKKTLVPKIGYSVGFSSGIVKQVYKMVDGNSDINEISKSTKLSKAEIQLILNLRENRFTAPN
jgi:hypothetical protein